MDLESLKVKDIISGLRNKEFSSYELTSYYLENIKKDQSKSDSLNAYITLMENEALQMSKEVDTQIKKGDASILAGVPIGIKDNINIKDMPTTCASKILEGYRASYDATVVERLIRKEKMIPLGKLNMDEFAMGSSNETSHYGVSRNPFDRTRVPGGSSGGVAAAVSSGLAPVALGSDTGGSIRQPAAFCGVVGLKPTYGLVSRYGLVAFASSLDQIGPIAKCVEDAALILSAIEGFDEKDSTSLNVKSRKYNLTGNIKGVKVGIPKEYFIEGISEEVLNNINNVIELLKKLGAEIVEISLPHSDYAVPTYYIVATAEASSNLERFDGIKYGYREKTKTLSELYFKSRSKGFGTEVKRRIMLGTYVLSSGYYDAYYLKALKVRKLIKNDFDNAFKNVDVILSPTSPTPAFKIGEKLNDPISMYLSDIYTIAVNLAGLPAISIPTGFSKEGLPLGSQFIGRLLDEETILNVSFAIEKALN
ncbi:MAG: Asp-tRNA(Asn)/Glu-tRNA(Gln) amidotransferase subunit GatA [Brevinematales bacterium]|nr:Asp-tRNA(Asn)/Glu-tRNA(Gln) amidotransferase subunit GatA [Brevinematales bacterium]